MTLIVSVATPRYCVHASDRQLTRVESGEVHDSRANKTVVVFAEDGAAVLSYSGPSYVGRKPTDQVIAERILGNRFQNRKGMIPDTLAGIIFLAEFRIALDDVSQRLSNVTENKQLRKDPFWINHVDLQYGETPCVRFNVWSNSKLPGASSLRAAYAEAVVQVAPPGYLDADYVRRLAESSSAIHRKRKSIVRARFETTRMILRVLRQAAKQHGTIGPDTLSVAMYLEDAQDGFMTIEYLAASHRADYGYSPWIITPGGYSPPRELTGSWQENAYVRWANGPLPMNLVGPDRGTMLNHPDGRKLQRSITGHRREPPPSRR